MFEDFLKASELHSRTVREYAARLSRYDASDRELNLEYSKETMSLPRVSSKLSKLASCRHSSREFQSQRMSLKQLSQILHGGYAHHGLEHRGYASAGATYASELFAISFNVDGTEANRVYYYDAETHGIVDTSRAISWRELDGLLHSGVKGVPQIALLCIQFPSRTTDKYGERGGRFALLEAGALMQQLSLAVAEQSKQGGVLSGGWCDQELLELLDMPDNATVGFVYLVGASL